MKSLLTAFLLVWVVILWAGCAGPQYHAQVYSAPSAKPIRDSVSEVQKSVKSSQEHSKKAVESIKHAQDQVEKLKDIPAAKQIADVLTVDLGHSQEELALLRQQLDNASLSSSIAQERVNVLESSAKEQTGKLNALEKATADQSAKLDAANKKIHDLVMDRWLYRGLLAMALIWIFKGPIITLVKLII